MAYATLEELKSELDLTYENTDDNLLQRKLDEAQGIIEQVCHRRFEAGEDETRLIDWSEETVDGRTLYLPEDLCQITEVVNGDGETVPFTAFVTEPRLRTVGGGVIALPDSPKSWPWYALTLKASSTLAWTYDTDPEEAISVTGRWAFSVTAPAIIKGVTLALTDWLYHRKDNPQNWEESDVSPEGVLLLMSDLPADIQRRLMPFVRVE